MDMYGDESDAPAPSQNQSAPAPKDQGKEDAGETFLLSKEICPMKKVGDTITGKIVAAHDSEFEVEYQHDDKEENGAEGGEPAMAEAPAEGGGGMYD